MPARYFTGLGSPIDVLLSDLSTGGCRIPSGGAKLTLGSPIQIFVGGSGPHRGNVKWINEGEIGIGFLTPLDDEFVEGCKNSHVPVFEDDGSEADFDDMPDTMPQRFC